MLVWIKPLIGFYIFGFLSWFFSLFCMLILSVHLLHHFSTIFFFLQYLCEFKRKGLERKMVTCVLFHYRQTAVITHPTTRGPCQVHVNRGDFGRRVRRAGSLTWLGGDLRSSGRHELDVPRVEDPGQEAQDLPDVLLRELHRPHGVLPNTQRTAGAARDWKYLRHLGRVFTLYYVSGQLLLFELIGKLILHRNAQFEDEHKCKNLKKYFTRDQTKSFWNQC